eukprot:362422-Pleurochrysis_carterae.AAC.1
MAPATGGEQVDGKDKRVPVRQVDEGLRSALAEGALAHEHCAARLHQRGGKDLSGGGGVAIDEQNERQPPDVTACPAVVPAPAV